MINKAKWITAGAGVCAPCIERKFYLDSKNKAELEITGLGYFICKINGKPVSDDRFMPVVSDYKERTFSDLLYPCNDKNFVHRVYYLKFDISPLISVGENTIEIFLGNGWFIQKQRTVEGDFSFSDALIAKYAIKYNDVNGVDKIILSDGCERWKNTEVVSNNIFYGERQDARILDLEAEYKSVEIYPEFETKLTVQDCPNERLIKTLTPRVVCSSGGKTIFDVGENVSGYAKIMATGKYGDVIKVVYSGNIDTDGRLNTDTTGAWMKNDNGEYQLQQDQFILDGKKREYAPKFCRHCFRYFEVDGIIDSVVVEVIYTDLAVTANFQSSSDTLNWIYDAYIRTQLNNMHDGFPSDCPHRERLGYTGDGQITAPAAMLTIDTEKFYRKWIRDVADGQNQENGHVQYTAPYFGGAGGPGGWGGAIVFVPYAFYKRFNDLDLIKQYFPNMKLWVKYMEDHTENGIVVNAEDGGYCLGDWGFPEKRQLPEAFVNTVFLVLGLIKMQEMALAVGMSDQIPTLKEKERFYKTAIVEKFYDPKTERFCGGVQGADAFALEIGLGGRELARCVAEHYDELGYYDTGIFGTYLLTKNLFDYGYADVAFKLLTKEEKPSFGYLKNCGATTLYENLLMTGSDCHPMFGAVVELFFTRIMGLAVSSSEKYVVKPCIPKGLTFAKASIKIEKKEIFAEFERVNECVEYEIKIPNGFNAEMHLNGQKVPLKCGNNKILIK